MAPTTLLARRTLVDPPASVNDVFDRVLNRRPLPFGLPADYPCANRDAVRFEHILFQIQAARCYTIS